MPSKKSTKNTIEWEVAEWYLHVFMSEGETSIFTIFLCSGECFPASRICKMKLKVYICMWVAKWERLPLWYISCCHFSTLSCRHRFYVKRKTEEIWFELTVRSWMHSLELTFLGRLFIADGNFCTCPAFDRRNPDSQQWIDSQNWLLFIYFTSKYLKAELVLWTSAWENRFEFASMGDFDLLLLWE